MTYAEWKAAKASATKATAKAAVGGVKTYEVRTRQSLQQSYETHRKRNNLKSASLDEMLNAPVAKDFFSVNYGKMSEKTSEAFDKTFSDLTKKYDTTLTKIRLMDKNEYLLGKDTFAFVRHDYTVDNAVLVINPAKCGNHEALVERITELSERGYAVKMKKELADRYVATHEFAHTLIDMGSKLSNKTNFVGADYEKVKRVRKKLDGIYETYLKEIQEIEQKRKAAEMDFIMGLDNGDKARALGKELDKVRISKYSMTNPDDFFAEAFTHAQLNGSKNKYVSEIMDIVNKEYGLK
jgi:hypothetical protein